MTAGIPDPVQDEEEVRGSLQMTVHMHNAGERRKDDHLRVQEEEEEEDEEAAADGDEDIIAAANEAEELADVEAEVGAPTKYCRSDGAIDEACIEHCAVSRLGVHLT